VAGVAVIVGGLGAVCSAGAVSPKAGRFVYVAATKRNEVSQFRVTRSGALRPLKPASIPSGQFPYGIAVSPQGTSVYAVDVGPNGHPANKVSQYTINPTTGRLTPKSPATVATAGGPESIAISPNGKSAYVGDNNDRVSQYSISPRTGALRAKSPATVASGANASSAIAVTPSGKYVYVATCVGCNKVVRRHSSAGGLSTGTGSTSAMKATVWEYRVNPGSGALSTKPFAIVATGQAPQWIAIAPNDRSAYVASSASGGAIWQYSINPTTGKLTPMSPATAASGFGPHNIVIAPNGKNAYVTTVTNSKIAQYRVNQNTGTLSTEPVSTATTVKHPEALAITADGKNAYVTSEGDPKLSQYAINPTTGRITPMTPATVKTASGALGLAVTP
jgi:6-phosphogluconolactonase